MPTQQMTEVPARETAVGGRSAPRSRDKSDGRKKTPGRSGSRSSNISKVSNSTGLSTASRTSVSPSSQDICSAGQLTRLDEDPSESQANRQTHTSVMTVSSAALGSPAQSHKKQVKRRRRRTRDLCPALDRVEPIGRQERSDRSLSSDRSELGEKRERSSRSRRELPPHLRCPGDPRSGSTSEDEAWREARSWSQEKARRVCRRAGNSQGRSGQHGGEGAVDRTEVMELQSVSSAEGTRACQHPAEGGGGGLEERRGSGSPKKRGGHVAQKESSKEESSKEERSKEESSKEESSKEESSKEERSKRESSKEESSKRESSKERSKEERSKEERSKEERSQSRGSEESVKSHDSEGGSSPAGDGEALVSDRYVEEGSGGGDMSAPAAQQHCGVNGGTQPAYSDNSDLEVCRICHCEGDDDGPLITPCRCAGSLSFVHQDCLNQWIKTSDTRRCELCMFDFVMETTLKPLRKWEKLHMSKNEWRKIFCSVYFHLMAIACMLWSVLVLAKRTTEEIRLGKNEELWRVSLMKYYTPEGVLEWPFWTKLILVAIGVAGGLIFMYIQGKVYLQLWRRLKAFNRIITVQDCPEKARQNSRAARDDTLKGGRHATVEVPVGPAPVPAQEDSDMSVEAAVAPARCPV